MKTEIKEMGIIREKASNYFLGFAEYARVVFPKKRGTTPTGLDYLADAERTKKRLETEGVRRRMRILGAMREELEVLIAQALENPEITEKNKNELELLIDVIWLWMGPPQKIIEALEKTKSKK